jgi:hypothetical protein
LEVGFYGVFAGTAGGVALRQITELVVGVDRGVAAPARDQPRLTGKRRPERDEQADREAPPEEEFAEARLHRTGQPRPQV